MIVEKEYSPCSPESTRFNNRPKTDSSFLAENERVVTPSVDFRRSELNLFPRERSLKEILDTLASLDFDPQHYYYEFRIKGIVKPEDLRALISLPYETSIVEIGGRLIFRTEMERTIANDEEMKRRLESTNLFLHSHRIRRGQKVQANSPSLPDLLLCPLYRPSTVLAIACERGLILYGHPILDPVTKEIYRGDARDLMLEYCETRGVDIFGGGLNSNLTSILEVSPKEQFLLQRQFAEDTRAIKSEVAWGDRFEAEVMRLINRAGVDERMKVMGRLRDPFYLPSKGEVCDAFGGLNDKGEIVRGKDWWDFVCNPVNPRYEILTEEYVTALSDYLAERIVRYGGTRENRLTILEVGAGDGRLSHFLNEQLGGKIPYHFRLVATDNESNTTIQRHFPVETVTDNRGAINKYQPTIVISSWMPLGEDWTREFLASPSVREVIVIGHEEACGTPASWGCGLTGEENQYERIELEELEENQISRLDYPATVSLRRKPIK